MRNLLPSTSGTNLAQRLGQVQFVAFATYGNDGPPSAQYWANVSTLVLLLAKTRPPQFNFWDECTFSPTMQLGGAILGLPATG